MSATGQHSQAESSPGDHHLASAPTVLLAGELLLLLLVLVGSGLAGHLRAQANRVARLKAATENLRLEAGRQRDLLVAGIEAYKRSLGFYPPDHVLCAQPVVVDAVTNALLYELAGTFHNLTNETYRAPHFPPVRRSLVKELFGVESIRNAAPVAGQAPSFLDISKVAAVYAVRRAPDPVGLLAIWPNWEGMESDLYQDFELASWRYNCSAPEHNRRSFDLWVEIRTSQTNLLIKNW